MPIEDALAAVLSDTSRFGQLLIRRTNAGGFVVCHRDDQSATALKLFQKPEDAIDLARYDDAGKYRPLKTAPNLRHGWRLDLSDLVELLYVLDHFYPGRTAVLGAWMESQLTTTTLRETLERQSGMYRVAANISDAQADDVVANFCRSDSGCLRTIFWKRDKTGAAPSTKLPREKFDPVFDQTGHGQATIPLLCQEACNLLINECRKAVKGETNE